MKRSLIFHALAAGVVVLGFAALEARASSVALPTTYDKLIGNSTTVVGAETLTFSSFTYSSSSSPPPGSPGPAASSITVSPFAVSNETGIILTGTLSAAAGTMVDVSISYVVTAPLGEKINDAFLSTTGGPVNGGTGSYLVSETLTNAVTLAPITTLSATGPGGSPSDLVSFAGVQSILVSKDIFLTGGMGGNGVSLSVVTQAYSSTGVPEPASMALLGIGMTGLLAFRRFFKKASVA